MKINCIISEFNPFHNGHKYLIDSIKNQNDGYIAIIMSGDFVQRGDCAIFNKYARAKSAIKNGADLVVELPVSKSVAVAERFALGGVEIAKALNCNNLYFGSECGDIDKLKCCADAVINPEVNSYIKNNLQSNHSYPSLLTMAVEKYFSKEIADILKAPNNALAIEYIKAINKLNFPISAVTIKREAVEHDSSYANNKYASASLLRKMILEKNSSINNYIDEFSYKIFENEINNNYIASLKSAEKMIIYKLKSMKIKDFAELPEISEGIENRIFKAVSKFYSVNDIISSIKTKRYTEAKIRRIIIYSILGITEKIQTLPIGYIKPLCFNENGKKILSSVNSLPIISKASNYKKYINDEYAKVFENDIYSSTIRNIMCQNTIHPINDFNQKLFIP